MARSLLLLSVVFLAVGSARAQAVKRLEILPGPRVVHAPAKTQQLAVIAHFADGATRDVTRLTLFISDDSDVATVSPAGRVRFHQAGEVSILCRYQTLERIRFTHADAKPGFAWPNPPRHNFIDDLLFAQLQRMHVAPAELCSDEVFLRRAYLEACGILPTPREARAFLADRRPDKRARLIDQLLDRPEYAEYWAHHWLDLPELARNSMPATSGAALLDWARGQLAGNVPLDRIMHQLLRGHSVVTAEGPGNHYLGAGTAQAWAAQTAQAFLGIRIHCVRCHQLPETRLNADDAHAFTAFFSQLAWKSTPAKPRPIQMLTVIGPREWRHPTTNLPVVPRFPDGTVPRLYTDQDRREPLADWVAAPKNPLFVRAMANRLWYFAFGKGLAQTLESVNENRRTANDALLDALTKELIACRFDNKHMVRLMMNSHAWQLSARRDTHAEYDGKHFSHAYAPMLKSEVLMDAVSQFLETSQKFDGMPPGTRAMRIFRANPPFVHIGFSQPQRISECEEESTSDRRIVFFANMQSDEFYQRFKDPGNRIARLLAEKRSRDEMVDELFLAALSRLPSQEQRGIALKHVAEAKDRRAAWETVAWALVNTKEFISRP